MPSLDALSLLIALSRMPPPRWLPLKLEGKPLSRTIIEDREDRV